MPDEFLATALVFLAGCPRILGIVAVAPGFSAAFVPPMVRMTIAGGLALALMPLVAPPAHQVLEMTLQAYIALLISELVMGIACGFMVACLIEAARLGGEIVDLQIGFRVASLFDPISAAQSSLLGQMWYLLAILFFFQVQGHHWLCAGLARSFELCPVGAVLFNQNIGLIAVQLVSALFALALRIAAPVIAALILTDLTMGLLGRGMPQMNILMVGFPAKIVIGMAALVLSTPSLALSLAHMAQLCRDYLSRAILAFT